MSAPVPTAPVRRSRLQAEAVRSLTVVRSRADRVRSRATTAAATGIGVALVMAGAVATVRDTVLTESAIGYVDADGNQVMEQVREPAGGLAPFLVQEGLRPGVVVAAVLLVLPFLALAVQALRVGKVVEDRRSRQLLTAGATWADLRRLRVARTTTAFVRGGLLAAPAYLLLWLVLGVALPEGLRMLPQPSWTLPIVWLLALGVLWSGGLGLAVWSVRADRVDLRRRAGLPLQAPSYLLVLLPAVAGFALLLATVSSPVAAVFPVALVVALVLFLVAAGAGSARSAAGAGTRTRGQGDAHVVGDDAGPARRRRPRWLEGRDVAVSVLADAQRRGSALAVTGTAGVLFVCGLSFGVESTLVAGTLTPVDGTTGYGPDELAFYVGGAALAGAVGVVAAVVAVAALVLSLTDQLLGNRRAVASTAALGVETRRLVAVQARCLIRTAVPVTVLGVLASALPYTLVTLGDLRNGWSWAALLPVAVALVSGLLMTGLCWALAAALTGRVREAAALTNLRVA